MERTSILKQDNSYETTELKLAGLLLAEIPGTTFEVYPQNNSSKKIIKIFFNSEHQNDIRKLEMDFINKQALANVYAYNKALHLIRDRIKL